MAILPVGVFVLVIGVTAFRSLYLVPLLRVSTITFALGVEKPFKVVPVNCSQVHIVTVDDFGLLFQIESLFMALNIRALNLAVILLGVR